MKAVRTMFRPWRRSVAAADGDCAGGPWQRHDGAGAGSAAQLRRGLGGGGVEGVRRHPRASAAGPGPGPKSDAGTAAKTEPQDAAPPLNWFERSRRDFQALMGMLAGGAPPSRPWDPVADAEKKAAASTPMPQGGVPQPGAATAPRSHGGAMQEATEERRLAETRRAEADKRADAREGRRPSRRNA